MFWGGSLLMRQVARVRITCPPDRMPRQGDRVQIADGPPAIRKRCGVTEEISFIVPPGTTSQWSSRVRCYETVDLEKSGATMRTELLRFNGAVERDPAIDAWMKEHAGESGTIAHQWFAAMRTCVDVVRVHLHDAC